MKLEFSAEDEAFRREVAEWMKANLVGEFEVLRFRGGPGDEEAYPALRKKWERKLAEGGWACVNWPQEHGGRGLSLAHQVIFHEEYARAGGPGRLGHLGEGLIGPTILALGSEDQKQRFLPGIREGRDYWCQGYSEPGAGSDLANVQTKAVFEDGKWKVTGQKVWTSLAHECNWIFVLARCEAGSKGHKGLIFLLMPLDQPGVEVRPIKQLTGTAEFNEVFFDGAVALPENVIGEPGDGWKVAMALLAFERGTSTLGQQMHFIHELELIAAEAKKNGAYADPSIRQRIALAWAGLRAMRYNALRMLSGTEDGTLPREGMMYKYFWSNWHRDLGKLAMDILGNESMVVDENDLTRQKLQGMFMFTRSDTIYAGTNEIQLNIISERALGLPREPR